MRTFVITMLSLLTLSAHAAHVEEPKVGDVPPTFSAKNAVTGEPINLADSGL
jgi:hypothetical protein